ncbi:MAG TPA: putative lipid II flippase FtsW [Gaiellaceae bacterium]|nr:putative lipid II flippase FtsW [Gaiellaceae bacterium]HZT54341.1 putative lipid II flippase FtsW [Gaiellaceae bacterium]
MKRAQLESNVLVLVTLALTAFGLVMVYSATSARAADGNGQPMYYLTRQAIFALAGVVALVLAARTPYGFWRRTAPTLLVISLVLLAGVLVAGSQVNGARRWIPLGAFSFQPSELAKVALAAWAAAHLARRRRPTTLGELVRPLGVVAGLACVLVLVEPDLGTAIAIALMIGGMLVVAGTPGGLLARCFAIVTALGVLAIWLEPYRRARLFSFLNPWGDPQGAGFQVVQAMIGLGSGGIFGVGIGHGVIKNFDLPEAHTDMIFATIGEELGLVGTAAVIAAYAAFAWAGLRIALACRDPFGKVLASGLTVLVCAQAAINLAAVLGIAPLTGITLPFVSYGGSSLIAALASTGILLNIGSGHGAEGHVALPDRGRGDRRPRRAVDRRRRGAARARRAGELRRVAGSARGAARS